MKNLLNAEIEKICRKSKLMGANIVLFDKEQIVYDYYYGYANKGRNIKSTRNSLYMIGSNTKVMTAVCILKLMEEGVLSLDDDIRKFIPEFEVKSAFDYDKITIANLLMHRSGLVGDLFSLIFDRTRDLLLKERQDFLIRNTLRKPLQSHLTLGFIFGSPKKKKLLLRRFPFVIIGKDVLWKNHFAQ